MTKALRIKEIQEIVGEMQCPKNFKCYKSGFKHLCRAKDFGIESFLECLESEPEECKFSFSVEGINYCQCPLRCYIAQKMKK